MSGADNPFPFMQIPKFDGSFADLSAASAKTMTAWTKAWQAALTGRALPAMGFFNPALWSAEGGRDAAEALESWLGTPQWSDMVSFDQKTLKGIAPAVELMQVAQQYTAAVAKVCADVCSAFQAKVKANGGRLDGAGEAMDLWNATVDETLMAFNRSDTFADLQRRFLRALMGFRLEQRRMAGRVAEHYDLPTREEIDELARRVHSLERENRVLRRKVLALGEARVAHGASGSKE